MAADWWRICRTQTRIASQTDEMPMQTMGDDDEAKVKSFRLRHSFVRAALSPGPISIQTECQNKSSKSFANNLKIKQTKRIVSKQ